MIVVAATAISVVLDGSVVPAAQPARVVNGTIAAPLRAIVARLAAGETVSTAGDAIAISAGGHTVVLHVGSFEAAIDGRAARVALAPFRDASVTFVPLARIVHALGGTIVYDPRAKTASVAFDRASVPLATMTPFDPAAPSVTPTTLFTPSPAPTVRPTEEPSPHPRRTAIPATPSSP